MLEQTHRNTYWATNYQMDSRSQPQESQPTATINSTNRAHLKHFTCIPTKHTTYFCLTSDSVKMTYNYTLQFVYLSPCYITQNGLSLTNMCHCSSFWQRFRSHTRTVAYHKHLTKTDKNIFIFTFLKYYVGNISRKFFFNKY